MFSRLSGSMDFGDSVENPIKQHPKPWESRRRGSKLPPYFDLSPENEERAKRNIRFHLPRYLADLLEIPMDPCEMEERPMFVKQVGCLVTFLFQMYLATTPYDELRSLSPTTSKFQRIFDFY